MGLFGKEKREEIAGAIANSHNDLADFHAREVAKYQAKADEARAAGNEKIALRAEKVVARNQRLAEKHAAR